MHVSHLSLQGSGILLQEFTGRLEKIEMAGDL